MICNILHTLLQDVYFKFEDSTSTEGVTPPLSAHRALLCARSEIFQNMLLRYSEMSSSYAAASSGDSNAVLPLRTADDDEETNRPFHVNPPPQPQSSSSAYLTLPHCSRRAARSLLTFLYSDTITVMDVDQLVELLALACEYRINYLILACEGALSRLVDEFNVFTLLQYAEAYFLPVLRKICISAVLRNYSQIMKGLPLPAGDVKEGESGNPSGSISAGDAYLSVEFREELEAIRRSESHIYMMNEDHRLASDREQGHKDDGGRKDEKACVLDLEGA